MSQATVRVMTCDRCGQKAELRDERGGYLWGRLAATHVNGPVRIGATGAQTSHGLPPPVDLCPNCTERLMTWWKARAPAEEEA